MLKTPPSVTSTLVPFLWDNTRILREQLKMKDEITATDRNRRNYLSLLIISNVALIIFFLYQIKEYNSLLEQLERME